MDLDLAPDHVLLRDTIREFMTEEVAALVDEHEKARRFPTEVVRFPRAATVSHVEEERHALV